MKPREQPLSGLFLYLEVICYECIAGSTDGATQTVGNRKLPGEHAGCGGHIRNVSRTKAPLLRHNYNLLNLHVHSPLL